jgi:cytochrome P450
MPLDSWHLDQVFIHRLTNDRWNFIQQSRVEATQRAKERTQAGHDAKKDFFYYLLNAKDPETGHGLSTPELWGEANVLMIAGSDTTSTGLASTIFYLIRTPRAMAELTKEIRTSFSNVEDIVSGPELNNLVYLKACIDEAMRLAPAVPGAMPREVLPGGTEVDGVYLPGGTDCGTPCYAIHRHPDYYREPESFMPERWIEGAVCQSDTRIWLTSRQELDRARQAFCPFSIGPRGCIGKSMALMEMKLTLARMLFLFDVGLADSTGEDKRGHLALVDHFTSHKTGPDVIISKRSS